MALQCIRCIICSLESEALPTLVMMHKVATYIVGSLPPQLASNRPPKTEPMEVEKDEVAGKALIKNEN